MGDVREKSTALLASTLETHAQQSGVGSQQAIALEAAVYAKFEGDTGNQYRNEIRQLSLDLGKNNIELGQQVANGEIDPNKVVHMTTEQRKSSQRAAEDSALREQALRESLGEDMIPIYEAGGQSQGPAAATDLSQEGEVGAHEASMGADGEYKARGQPKIPGLEGIEFETGM